MADRLATYRSMRDFSKTAEPSGKTAAPKSERLRFIIQKHAATRLHYDLRLEYEGVFLSWAVTKGPSLDPHDKRLAVEVEPHPLSYGDFEGTIPKGQYGGGTVMLWDRGYWKPDGDMPIEKQLKKGHLAFHFEGKRLKGGYHLVRLRNDREGGRQRNNWLLIKQHDQYAHEGDEDAFLADTDFSVASGRKMAQIAEGKGRAPTSFIGKLKQAAGAVWNSKQASSKKPVGEEQSFAPKPAATRTKPPAAKPGPAPHGRKAKPEFVKFQLCKLVDRPPQGSGWVHEIKFDGYRIQAVVKDGKARLFSRKGLDWTERFPEIADECAGLPTGAYDGEIVALDSEGRPDFAGLQAALSSKKTGKLVFFLFDAPFAEGEDLRKLALSDRKDRLQTILAKAKSATRLRFVEHFGSSGAAVLESACRMDLEGIVSKRADAPYQSGRSETWTKAKCRGGQEVVIAGWTTTGDSFRSLIAGLYRDGQLVHIGRIGTGFGAEKVRTLLPKLKRLETDASPFKGPGAPRKAANIHWVKPELVAEIAFAGFTGAGNIRQASFKGLREDKPARDVIPETAEARDAVDASEPAGKKPKTARSKAKAAPRPGSAEGNVVLGVTISNPDKALWPAKGKEPPVSKLEHARYLESVMDWLMPHIVGRPCSIIRTPDGIEGAQRFFQRHAGAGTSSLITLAEVSGDRDPYLQFDRPEAVIAGAQSGATEFHPWNCLPGEPELPGRFVFDLDPDEAIPFERVVAAAKDVKERLEAVGLTPFLKTTGGKGLHVVTPLRNGGKTPVEWPEAKAFTKQLVTRMADDSPELYTVNMAKKVRGGRIFLDYLRNDRMSTAVALLSARARPGATVSFPLTWGQARKGLDPKAYTVRTAPALMKRNKAWDGYDEAAGSLKDAIKRLGKT
jgi:bifunctional non-homologous end joining protein LigD